MNNHFGRAVDGQASRRDERQALRTPGRPFLAAAIAGLVTLTGLPASAESAAKHHESAHITVTATHIALPSLGRHVRRAARLPFNVSLKFDEATSAKSDSRPHLTRFVRARGHGSEATAVDSYGPDRLVESLTFPTGAPPLQTKGTALADVNESAAVKPGL